MSNFNDIKKRLAMSTTLPAGTGGSTSEWLMGSAAAGQNHDHAHHHEESDECDKGRTNPSGGCGCC